MGADISPTGGEREIAEDYRRQLQERVNRRLIVPRDIRTAAEAIRGHSLFLAKVYSTTTGQPDVGGALEDLQRELESGSLPSPHDDALFHAIVRHLGRSVEQVCSGWGLPVDKIALGVSSDGVLEAARHAVPTTDASVVSISAGMILFCSHLSKVMALSLPHRMNVGQDRIEISHEVDEVFERLNQNPTLKKDWFEVLGAYAYGDPSVIPHRLVPFPASYTCALFRNAMELFAIAHEYGHHVCRHGRSDEASVGDGHGAQAVAEEFEADRFALAVSRQIDLDPFAASGAGAVLLMKGLEFVRRASEILKTGTDDGLRYDSHPRADERVRRLAELASGLDQKTAAAFMATRQNLSHLLDRIWVGVRPLLLDFHEHGIGPVEFDTGWRPG